QQKEKENIEYGKAHTFTNLGIIANMQGNYKRALARYDEALEIYSAESDGDNQARVHINIGMTYIDQGEYSKAINMFEQGLQLITEIEDQELRGLIHLNMAKALALNRKYSKAEKLAKKALKMFKLMGDSRSVAEAYHIFGLIHGMQGNLSEAELFLNESLRLTEQEENFELFAETCQSYADVCKQAGRKQKAKEFYDKALATYKKLNLKNRAKKVQARLDQLQTPPENNHRKINVVDGAKAKTKKPQQAETRF
ncbi:MAG: tetratricopeptide repeat protein, partial [bacterium]